MAVIEGSNEYGWLATAPSRPVVDPASLVATIAKISPVVHNADRHSLSDQERIQLTNVCRFGFVLLRESESLEDILTTNFAEILVQAIFKVGSVEGIDEFLKWSEDRLESGTLQDRSAATLRVARGFALEVKRTISPAQQSFCHTEIPSPAQLNRLLSQAPAAQRPCSLA